MDWSDGRLSEPTQTEQNIYEVLALGNTGGVRKPLLLYLSSNSPKDKTLNKKIEDVVLKDERIRIGAKLFTLVRLPSSRADARVTKLVGKTKGPAFAIFSTKGKKMGLVNKKVSGSKIFAAMKKAAKKDYRTSLSSLAKKVQKILTSLDKLVAERKNLEKRSKKKGKAKKIQKELAEIEKKIAALDKEEQKIWEKLFKKSGA